MIAALAALTVAGRSGCRLRIKSPLHGICCLAPQQGRAACAGSLLDVYFLAMPMTQALHWTVNTTQHSLI